MKKWLILSLLCTSFFVFAQNLDVEGNAVITGDVDVFGNIDVEGPNEFIDLINSGGSSLMGLRFYDASTFDGAIFYRSSTEILNISNGASNPGLVYDMANNRTGIGTLTPSTTLDVVGDAEINGNTDINGKLEVVEAGSEIARFSSTAGSKWISLYQGATRRGLLWSTGSSIKLVSDAGNVAIQTGSNIDRLTVNTAGQVNMGDILYADPVTNRVGVFTTSPDYTFEVEHTSGTPGATTGNGFTIKNNLGAADNHWSLYNWSSGNFSLYKGGSVRGTFDATTGAYTNASDRRLKTDIRSMEDGQIAKIMQLVPSVYKFKNQKDDEFHYGLIAQDVQSLIPAAVNIIESTSEGAERDLYGIDYSSMTPVLIKAIQEQQDLILQLQARIEALESK